MNEITLCGLTLPCHRFDAVVVGSGCAGLNAADSLYGLGVTNVALLTEGMKMGTSRNTGSDKQTYYKLSLASDDSDSVTQMAETLFSGVGVNGDTALAEAAGSVRAFMKLVELGVDFPTNEYGEYVGYKTDHDPARRATSAGPLTSHDMTEALEAAVRRRGLPIFDHMTAVRLLVEDGRVFGLLAVDQTRVFEANHGLTLFLAPHIVLATGGPADLYADSVYPCGHRGMLGMALEAGAQGVNLQEWQFGLASIDFRWNVSGTYQQVLPRYISIDADGNEHEFLPDYITDPADALLAVFQKGYQWPFDARKREASSRIDCIVYHETVHLGRKVYLDFRQNPAGLASDFSNLPDEAREYLDRSGAHQATPFARLMHMNPKAIDLYRSHGIDLETEPLRIAVCAQHHNGGIAVDADWQTDVAGLYAAGECAGTFGVYRPGGSALNATQVGSLRAAQHIARTHTDADVLSDEAVQDKCGRVLTPWLTALEGCLSRADVQADDHGLAADLRRRMSADAGCIRTADGLAACAAHLADCRKDFFETYIPRAASGIVQVLRLRDLMTAQAAVVDAMRASAEAYGSRGAALVLSETTDDFLADVRERTFTGAVGADEQLVTALDETGAPRSFVRPVRPFPTRDNWFETAWAAHLARWKR